MSDSKPWAWKAFGITSAALAERMACWTEVAQRAQEVDDDLSADLVDLLVELPNGEFAECLPESRLTGQTWICRLRRGGDASQEKELKVAVRQVPGVFVVTCSLSDCGGGDFLVKFCALAGDKLLQAERSSSLALSDTVIDAALAAAAQHPYAAATKQLAWCWIAAQK